MQTLTCTRWAFDLSTWRPTLLQLTHAVAAVQPEERTRLMKFVFIEDFLSSLVGRLLMRKYVSEQSGLKYHEVQFKRDTRGKPYWVPNQANLKNVTQLSFNVSHHGDFVVLAGVVADSTEDTTATTIPWTTAAEFGVGIDVMKIEYTGGKSLSEFFRIMKKKFSEPEWSHIKHHSHNEYQQLKAFMRHWCLKEAYVKEIGVGITIDLQNISFSCVRHVDLEMNTQPLTGVILHYNKVLVRNWHFEEHLLKPNYCTAIAFKKCKPTTEKFVFLTIDDLLVESAIEETSSDILEYCEEVLRKERKSL